MCYFRSLLTGLFAPSSGSIEVYDKDMQTHIDDVRKELGVCMQYDVHFDHLTAKEHLMLYGQIKAPHWTKQELQYQVRKYVTQAHLNLPLCLAYQSLLVIKRLQLTQCVNPYQWSLCVAPSPKV